MMISPQHTEPGIRRPNSGIIMTISGMGRKHLSWLGLAGLDENDLVIPRAVEIGDAGRLTIAQGLVEAACRQIGFAA